jgi:predicted transcriptional regulator
VLEMLSKRERMTAPELAQALDLALNTANNRLKRLFDQGLIQREYEVSDKGLLYYYYFPIPVANRVAP